MQVQKIYNRLHSSQRTVIEHTNGLLKMKFRKVFKFLNANNLEFIPRILASACVLHNFILEAEDEEYDADEADIENEINQLRLGFDDDDDDDVVSDSDDEEQDELYVYVARYRTRIANYVAGFVQVY